MWLIRLNGLDPKTAVKGSIISASAEAPVLLVITGLPGSGKTSLGERLAEAYRLPYFDYDLICQPFLKGIEKRCGRQGSYAEFCARWRGESYAALMDPALDNLRLGLSIIISGPFTREKRQRDFFRRLREEHGRLSFISCCIDLVPDQETLKARLESRNSERDREKLASWPAYYHENHAPAAVWDADYTVRPEFTAEDNVFEQCAAALKKLAFGNR